MNFTFRNSHLNILSIAVINQSPKIIFYFLFDLQIVSWINSYLDQEPFKIINFFSVLVIYQLIFQKTLLIMQPDEKVILLKYTDQEHFQLFSLFQKRSHQVISILQSIFQFTFQLNFNFSFRLVQLFQLCLFSLNQSPIVFYFRFHHYPNHIIYFFLVFFIHLLFFQLLFVVHHLLLYFFALLIAPSYAIYGHLLNIYLTFSKNPQDLLTTFFKLLSFIILVINFLFNFFLLLFLILFHKLNSIMASITNNYIILIIFLEIVFFYLNFHYLSFNCLKYLNLKLFFFSSFR